MRALFLFACGSTLACGPSAESRPVVAPLAHPGAVRQAPPVTPDAPFRAQAPAPDGKLEFKAPVFQKNALRNGIPVYYARKSGVPLVTVHLVARGGADELGFRPGVGSMLGAMLERGTKKLTAIAISDRWEELGAHHSTYVGWSSSGLSVTVPREQLPATLELLAELAVGSTFPVEELERLRSQRLAALVAERTNPQAAFNNAANASVFGAQNPYGSPLGGTEKDVKALTRAEVVRAYKLIFAKGRLGIAVAGDVDQDSIQPLLEDAFGKLTGPAVAPKPPIEPPSQRHAVTFVEQPGPQSQIGIVGVGLPGTSKDRFAYALMNTILGGPFSSRVNLNLREKHAYTYGARSDYARSLGAGPFSVRASVVADQTAPATKELLAEVARMRTTDVTPEELRAAKDFLILSLPARFETTDDLARTEAELHVYGWPLDEYAQRIAHYEAITVADVRRVAETYLDPKRWRLVVVGASSVVPQLADLDVGPAPRTGKDVERYDGAGTLLRADTAKPN